MRSDSEIVEQVSGAVHGSRTRFWMYWISSAAATLIFLLFVPTIMMVPGFLPSDKLAMFSIEGVAVAISLGIGIWKPGSTEAPVMVRPFGSLVAVILLFELAVCVIGIVSLLHSPHLRF